MRENYRDIIDLIEDELQLQRDKWGSGRVLDSRLWMTILGEEFGEACRASLEHDPHGYIDELIDVAAVCISAIRSVQAELSVPDAAERGGAR